MLIAERRAEELRRSMEKIMGPDSETLTHKVYGENKLFKTEEAMLEYIKGHKLCKE